MRIAGKWLVLAASLAFCGPAAAATSITTTFQAKIVINAQCLINSANTLDFGTNGVLAANIDLPTTLSVTCTNLTTYNIGLDGGLNSAGVVTARKMKGGPSNELISYSLSTNTARTTNWGNTIGTDTVGATGNGALQSYTIYGRVPPQTTPKPGNYADTITLTVTY